MTQTDFTEKPEWAKLLAEAVSEPGKISEAYRRFHGYSLGNQFLALVQCGLQGLEPGPLASFRRWQELGRSVKKGQKAISLCMPITRKNAQIDAEGNQVEISYQFFVLKKNWFVLSQTEGQNYTPVMLPKWEEAQALAILEVEKVPFDLLNGNVQGYAAKDRKIAVSELAERPYKTLFHELAHILLGHLQSDSLTDDDRTPRNLMEVEAEAVALLCCASLDLPGVEFSRGYIQSWIQGQTISDKSAQKIFAAADKVLKAGTQF